jgi:AraC-like DNA-binding protein
MGHQNVSLLEEQLACATGSNERIDLIEKFLLSKLYQPTPDRLILNALQKIHLTRGMVKIKNLADTLYISHDAFEKRFRRVVGSSPKQFSSIVRMASITSLNRQPQKLTDLAFEAGYFDQAHFNKDFKSFTGQTPGDFFKSPSVLQLNDFLQ